MRSGLGLSWVVLEDPNDTHNVRRKEHYGEDWDLIEEEKCAEYIIEEVEPIIVIQIFTDFE